MSRQYDIFISELCDLLDGDYTLDQGFYTKNGRFFVADTVLYYKHLPFVIIERHNSSHHDLEFINLEYRLSNYQNYLDINWFVLWVNDGESIYVRSINDIDFKKYDNQNEVLKLIATSEGLHNKTILGPIDSKEYVKQVKGLIKESLNDLKQKEQVKSFLDQLKPNDIEIENDFVYFTEHKEKEFFLSLLTQIEDDSIFWRYTSSHSLFLLLNSSSQNLLSINCMNDKSEIDYADKYLYGIFSKNKKTYISTNVQEANQVFILSCCDDSNYDDLLMWRLYGQDAEGISIGYAINKGKIDFNKFFIAKVSYAKDDLSHKELELIGNMIEAKFQSRDFRFRKWAIWKHFFKPYEFNYENEIRLVYFDKEKTENAHTQWIEDSKNGIVSPMKIFLMNKDFPLILKRIIIGPKAHESEINRLQYKAMFDSSSIFRKDNNDLVISESSISIYR